MSKPSSVIACLTYRDPRAAIEWLCSVFGFEQHVVYAGDDGGVQHAELIFGNGMIMLGGHRDTDYGRLVRLPQQMEGYVTQSVYVVTSTPDEIYARAKQRGARIVIEIKDEDYGSRGFTCADPEGHLWSLGTYDPWRAKTQV